MDILQYPFITPYSYVSMYTRQLSPLGNWLAFGKLPENPIVTPSTSVQVIRPSGANRYLESVTVEATA